MKYNRKVHLVTRKRLSDAAAAFKEAERELRSWIAIVEAARWRNFTEVKAAFMDADWVDGYVVFNLRHNRYRLITVIHYAKDKPKITNGHVYIRSFLRHADYNDRKNWDPFAG